MGAHLKFKVEEASNAAAANRWLDEQPETELLTEYEYAQRLHFMEEPDFGFDAGEGQIKPSAVPYDTADEVREAWVSLFERLHDHDEFTVKILASSCALRLMTFSVTQLKRLTDNGDALSGPKADRYRRMIEKATDTPADHEFTQLATPGVPELLDQFAEHPEQTVTRSELADAAGVEPASIDDAITALSQTGVVTSDENGNYELSRESNVRNDIRTVYTEYAPSYYGNTYTTLFDSCVTIDVLNAFLIFETETLRVDMLADMLPHEPLAIEDACDYLAGHEVLTVSMSDFYSLNTEHNAANNLLSLHDTGLRSEGRDRIPV